MAETHIFQTLDDLITALNGYGRFQQILTVVLAVLYFSPTYHMMIIYFVAAEPHWEYVRNNTYDNDRNIHPGHIDPFHDNPDNIDPDHIVAKKYYPKQIYPSLNDSHCGFPRDQWKYVEPLHFSIITEFNLSCTRRWMAYSATSTYFFGWILGSVALGLAANIFGRKRVLCISCLMIVLVGFVSAFSSNIYFFLICRFIIGFFTYGNVGISHVLIGELVDNDNRPFASVFLCTTYAVALSVLGLKAYYIRKWRHLLIACTIPYLLPIVLFYKYIPESVRWLHQKRKMELFFKECDRIAKWNKIDMPNSFRILSGEYTNSDGKRQTNFVKLFRTCASIKTTTSLMFIWFMTCILYFSFFLSADNFNVSIYVSFILFSVVEIPANILGAFCMKRFGRLTTIPTSLIVASMISLSMAFIPARAELITFRLILGIIGQGLFELSFNCMIPWTVEVLSTDVRAVGFGLVSGFGRLGGGFSSWLAKGLKMMDWRYPFIVVGVWGIISSGIMYYALPETKGAQMKEYGDADNSDIDICEHDALLNKEEK